MASSSAEAENATTPAQRMAAMHDTTHQPTVEEVTDEADLAQTSEVEATPSTMPQPMSATAAGKQKEATGASGNASKRLDVSSEELFPSLGAPKVAAPASSWGAPPASVTAARARPNGTSAQPKNISIPGTVRDSFTLQQSQMKPRSDLRKPLPDIIKDINRVSRAKVEMRGSGSGIVFMGSGPTQESVRDALKEVVNQVGAKQTLKVQIPASVRPHIIGKGGSVIQGISKRTGARVQLPKATGPESDDDVVEVEIEGNPIAVQYARHQIESIVNERTATLSQRLRNVPAEFFPFIAGPHNSRISALEGGRDVRVKVPHYYTWSHQPPPEQPAANQPVAFLPQDGAHIQVSGEREAVRQVQEEIERQVQQLQRQLTLNRLAVERERHRFILGQAGEELHNFLQETGCSIILPPANEPDTEDIVIVGPADQVENAMNKVMDLASSMQMATVDVARQHANAARGAQAHARDVTRYLQQRKALADFEKAHNAQIVTPMQGDGHIPWQIYARDGKSTMKARSDLLNLVSGHPPSRFRNVNLHPYYQQHLQKQHAQQLRDEYGVHAIVGGVDNEAPLLLVYEGQGPRQSYNFPRSKPSESEIAEFAKSLKAAEDFISSLTAGQGDVVHRSVDAPTKYREKIQRHAARELERETQPQYPIQFVDGQQAVEPSSARNTYPVQFRGPVDVVEAYATALQAFIEEQIRDEAERGYVTTLDFPQKYANLLIGRRGESVNKIRDEFDVDVQVNEGTVSIQGPQAKAEKAKSHIASLLRKFEDETTHRIKIPQQFHRELVGPKGSTVLKLQDRYNTRIQFPRNNVADDQSIADSASEAGTKARGPAQASDEVVIKGSSRGADQARDELLSLFQYLKDNSFTATVNVAQSMLPALIGQGGKELDALRLETGATIDIPPRGEAEGASRVEIKLKGSKQAVETARKVLQARSKEFDATVSRTMEIDPSHHQSLIGARGENLKRMIVAAGGEENARRLIQFPRAGAAEPSLVRFEGNEDVVAKLMASLESLVAERDRQVSEIIEISPDKHGKLIGRQGMVRRGLESDFEVELSIPSQSAQGPERSQIKVTGLPSNVQRAKERIVEMTKDQEGATIQVPVRLHHAVIDTNQNFFRNLSNNYKVTVDHAGRPRPPKPEAPAPRLNGGSMPLITDADEDDGASQVDVEAQHAWDIQGAVPPAGAEDPTIPWILKGADAESVAKARQLIEKAMETAQESCTGYLILPNQRLHRLVIGPAGATINKIRKQSGCKIDVPKNSGAVEPITITGKRSGVEEAKGLIIEAVVNGSQR